jgi:Spy/CpxP family protein refolding chaperone
MMSAVLIALVLFAGSAHGQPRGPKPPSPAERAEQLKKDLGLNAVQTTKIKAIYEEQEKEMRKSFGPPPDAPMDEPPGPPPGDPEEMRGKMMKQQKELSAKIAKVLTPEQKKKFDELEKERMKRMEERPGPGE